MTGPTRRDLIIGGSVMSCASALSAHAAEPVGSSGRSDTMVLHGRNLPWEPHKVRGAGCVRRIFSRSAADGSESFALRLPRGYKLAGPVALASDFEFFVVRGEVEINEVVYGRDCYGMHPANYVHRSFRSAEGATLLVITNKGPDGLRKPGGDYRKDRVVEFIDNRKREWSYGVNPTWYPGGVSPVAPPTSGPRFQPGEPPEPAKPSNFFKQLWMDPETGGSTFLYGSIPFRLGTFTKGLYTHTADAEYFILQGDYILGETGRMLPGSYCLWKANAMYGPTASEYGFYQFAKFYGPIVNVHDTKPVDLSNGFNPSHHYVLPPEMQRYGAPREMPQWWNMQVKA